MNGFMTILRRDLAQHRLVWAAATFAGVVPFLIPVARGMHGLVAEEARAATAVSLSLAFLYALSCFLAGTVIPAGIASRRIGFDFARPLSTAAIWGGTLAAIALLAAGSAALVALPAALANRTRLAESVSSIGAETSMPIGLWLLGSVVLAGLAQAGSVALRSRSALLIVDLLFLSAAVLLVPVAFPILVLFAKAGALGTLIGAAGIVVLAATFVALAAGRTDIRRAHRAQSLVLWCSVALGWAALGVATLWLQSHTLQRVRLIGQVTPAPSGEWLDVEASTTGRIDVRFLLDSSSREFLRLNPGATFTTFSRDGRQAAWLDLRRREAWQDLQTRQLRLATSRLGERSSPPVSWPLPWTGPPVMLVLDPDAGRAAVSNGRDVTVLSLHDGKTIASASLPTSENYLHSAFTGGAVRILYASPISDELYRVEIFALDIRTSRLSHTGTVDAVDGWPYSFSTDASGERLLLRTRRGILLADARDGRRIAVLSEAPAGSRDATFVSGERVVVAEQTGVAGSLSCITVEGASVWSVPLPKAPQLTLGGEIRPGELVVGLGPFRDQEILAANLATGAMRRIAEHMSPVAGWTPFFAPLDSLPAPGEPATRLFYGPDDSLVRLDPETGEKTVLLGGATPK
jgi:hypothetical protein